MPACFTFSTPPHRARCEARCATSRVDPSWPPRSLPAHSVAHPPTTAAPTPSSYPPDARRSPSRPSVTRRLRPRWTQRGPPRRTLCSRKTPSPSTSSRSTPKAPHSVSARAPSPPQLPTSKRS
ncbi:hypothetical protein T235_17385 [Tannerella sp. oral taxon BU063 isolate Cell 8/11]|uniref:Uncharacterized protein n=1 Tax=Tannerella sp. oral taxon BU063 isolate Cell 8/11 TaxID=1411915 RepID=W2CX99_9BACT|nr:hypothetical protein T235_17385 [Tannerella sp. oral taxon BU063 isolate Cell 8/11]